MMSIVLLSLAGLVFAGLLFFTFFLLYRQSRTQVDSKRLEERLDHLQTQLRINLDGNTQLIARQVEVLTKQIDDRLGQGSKLTADTNKQINERLDNAAKVFGELQNKLGKLDEANQKIFDVGKDISSLQEILKRPKARGSLGEFFLADMLQEMLPRERFDLQYRFKNNEMVDAVIRIGDHLLSIDSKFPLDNFQRYLDATDKDDPLPLKRQFRSDVKKHIDSIARKYILPDEGTFDFALMYLMAENVYYEVITRDEDLDQDESLQAYALRKRIIPVSPNSFYAYLGALMHAMRGERMGKHVFEVVAQLRHLSIDLDKFREDFEKIGHHLTHLRSSYEASEKRLERYQERLQKVQDVEPLVGPERSIKLISN